MHASKPLLLALCLSLISASHAASDSSAPEFNDIQQQQHYTETTEEDAQRFKDGLHQMVAQFPIQPIEPLVVTIDGYCTAFKSLCSTICSERTTDETKGEGTAIGCADPKATSVVHADAVCKCAGFDLTAKVNFALVGGVVTSKGSKSGDFSADGILDGLTFLPGVSNLVSNIEMMQNACHYVGYLDVLVTDKNKASAPTGIDRVLGGLSNFFGSVVTTSMNFLGDLGSALGGLTGLLGGEDKMTIPVPAKATAQITRTTAVSVVSTATTLTKAATMTSVAIAAKPTTAAAGSSFDFLPFDGSEESGEDQDQDQGLDTKPIGREDRVARSVRVKRRYTEKVNKE
ncbi:hypothetical protein BGZ51_009527 [Haplosporangium sp. Z 767]|nr:hypothetical protein BGZ50_000794 [Haplosporangium sp. Z 11]KAF9194447.1 hypothetical protein BGZ51_009527 [Haplosporangium sp. Z 767]